MNDWLGNFIRALPRPAVTIIFAAVIADCVSSGRTLPTWFLSMAIPIITWWFAERTIAHKKERDSGF